MKAIKLTRVRGHLVGALPITPEDELFVMSSSGIGIRLPAKSISRQQREATGVRVMSLEEGAEIVAFTIVDGDDDD